MWVYTHLSILLSSFHYKFEFDFTLLTMFEFRFGFEVIYMPLVYEIVLYSYAGWVPKMVGNNLLSSNTNTISAFFDLPFNLNLCNPSLYYLILRVFDTVLFKSNIIYPSHDTITKRMLQL